MICPSCGGVLGRDCFNASECMWITQQMEREHVRQQVAQEVEFRHIDRMVEEYYQQIAHEHYEQLAYQESIEVLGFDPISLGM